LRDAAFDVEDSAGFDAIYHRAAHGSDASGAKMWAARWRWYAGTDADR
jgi:hypothetical protein